MELKWERVGHLASDIFPIVEHVHDITNLRTLIVGFFVAWSLLPLRAAMWGASMAPGSEMIRLRSDRYHIPHQSTVAL
jgi:hypothetical protein